MQSTRVGWAAVSVLCVVGCGGISIENGSGSEPTSSQHEPGGSGGIAGAAKATGGVASGNPVITPPRAADAGSVASRGARPPACDADGMDARPQTVADARDLLGRRWFVCDQSPLGGDADGIEFLADGSWYSFHVRADGSRDRDESGTITLALSEPFNSRPLEVQMQMESAGGTRYTVPHFTTTPFKLRLDNGGIIGTLAAGGDVPPVPGEPEIAADYPSPKCTSEIVTSFVPGTLDEVRTHIVGRWLACAGSIFTSPDGSVGLDIVGDGTFYKLQAGSTPGTVVRRHGFDHEGVWSAFGEPANGAGSFEVAFAVSGQNTLPTLPQFHPGDGRLTFPDLLADYALAPAP